MSFDSLFNILLIVLGFGLLIGIHELGHFLAAKWSGIRTNAFAIGMGPQVFSFRKGVGLCYKSTRKKVIAKCGKEANNMSDSELAQHGISETEYSLRLLPIGGFVSMLGQEDGKPDETSSDPRSFNMCSIGKRMVVVSAGVVMNLVLALVFFLICFQIGVNFESPIIGQIIPNSPASGAISIGNEKLPIESGDVVVSIDGAKVQTFQNIQIAGAMAKPGVPLLIEVQKPNLERTIEYSILPKQGAITGMLEIGLMPAHSTKLPIGAGDAEAIAYLHAADSSLALLQPGMFMKEASGKPVEVYGQFEEAVQASRGKPVLTLWTSGTEDVSVSIPVLPSLNTMLVPDIDDESPQNYESGLYGLSPLARVESVQLDSPNYGTIKKGDVFLAVQSLEFPRMGQLRNYLSSIPDGEVEILILRDGVETHFQATLSGGKLGVFLVNALELNRIAQPIREFIATVDGEQQKLKTPIHQLQLLGGSEVLAIDGKTIQNWSELRRALLDGGDDIVLHVKNPTRQHDEVTFSFAVKEVQYEQIANLGWTTNLPSYLFEPVYTMRSSGGNPIVAIQMGFDETINMVVMTYLTIDRLFRRTVGVEQLRGPVGIISIGSKIADRGLSYLLFFLAIISVNLAVLNFLPLPIVDGGLFLYLIYEKIFNKPPPIAFQNAAAVLGLCLIGALFLVTFYNDIARLISGAV